MTNNMDAAMLAGRRLLQVTLTEQASGNDAAVIMAIGSAGADVDGFLSIVAALKLSVFFIDYLLRLAFPDDAVRNKMRQDWFAQMEADTK